MRILGGELTGRGWRNVFDSTKVEKAFGLKATPYKEGIPQTVAVVPLQ